MIQESCYWKAPLLRSANWLERLHITGATAERSLVRIERELFVGFYGIRKLLETFKLSPGTRTLKFSLSWSPCVKMVDYMNAHCIEELFDLSVTNTEERNLEFLCNQFVHSYVFSPVQHKDGKLAGAYISSDRTKKDKVFFVHIDHILTAFRTVGSDYPTAQTMVRNEKTDQWEDVSGLEKCCAINV
jgi:hypothetical protein